MKETIRQIECIIDQHDRMKNSYFWTSPASAKARREYENDNSIPQIEWDENGKHFTAEFTVKCSCNNIYTYGTYTRDGKTTTLTAIKNSLKRIKASVASME